MNNLSLTGEITETHIITVPPEAREALEAEGVSVPERIFLELREATRGEYKRFEAAQAAASQDEEAQREPIIRLVIRRAAEGTDERVVRAVMEEITNSALTQLGMACMTGYMPDPKAAGRMVAPALKRATDAAFPTPAETSSFSVTSTTSDPETSSS